MFWRSLVINCKPRPACPSDLGSTRRPAAIIDVAGGDLESQAFSALVDDEVELETVEPPVEVLPRRATGLKTLGLWMRRWWQTTSEVASTKAIPVSLPRRVWR